MSSHNTLSEGTPPARSKKMKRERVKIVGGCDYADYGVGRFDSIDIPYLFEVSVLYL
jgi:hypothetical protein